MIKFFGLLSKKKKVNPKLTASIYVGALNNVVNEGFVEIKDFINNNNNLLQKYEFVETEFLMWKYFKDFIDS